MLNIAVLGATGHIAKALIYCLFDELNVNLFLFGRVEKKIQDFINSLEKFKCNKIACNDYTAFSKYKYDIIINCVGIGDPQRLEQDSSSIFMVTEEYDNLVIKYLSTQNVTAKYINLSSGAVYGNEFFEEIDSTNFCKIPVNSICESYFYCVAKINSEAKHRSFKYLNIVDIRIFSFFTRFIDLSYKYFLTDVVKCIMEGRVLKTGSNNMIRDYVHTKDLIQFVHKIGGIEKINTAFDIFSASPISKFETLEMFKHEFGLKYDIEEDLLLTSPTGKKDKYYTTNHKAKEIGYLPQFSSIQTLKEETKILIG